MESSEDNFENIINEIKYKSDNKDKRRERALAIGEYLQSNIFGDGFHKLDMIDPEKLSNATKSMKIAEKDVVLAIMDDTAFGSAKEGIALCIDGIYWKAVFESPSYISWDLAKDLYKNGKIEFKKSKIVFDKKNKIDLFMSQFKKADAFSSIEGILNII